PEPFQRLVNQGLILGEDGQKMSKSRGNVVNPDDVVREYGADALRLYEMFMGPLEQVKPWQMKGVEGVSRFLARVWRVAFEQDQAGEWQVSSRIKDQPCADKELLRTVHENPFAPHLSEEIHERLAAAFGRPTRYLSETPWPAYDPAALVRNEIEVVIQVNGKLRDRLMVPADADEETVKAAALASDRVREHLGTKTIRKIIFVPGKLLNIVAA
nr:class I tRNA ligase family protein [Akkermansiaceae bacterium]